FQTRVPDNRAVAQEYITLIELMASLLGASDEDVFQNPALHAKAKAVGTQWAAIMGSNAAGWETLETAMAPMLARLRAMGFDPTTENAQPTEEPKPAVPPVNTSGDVSIHLNSCPFIVDGKR